MGLSTRSVSAKASCESVLLLVYSLHDLPLETTPVPVLMHYLQSLFPKNYMTVNIVFNLNTKEGQNTVNASNTALEMGLTTGDLRRFVAS